MSAGDWTCVCGQTFRHNMALQQHGRTCAAEKARRRCLVRAIETGDWTRYAARYGRAEPGADK